MIYGRGKNSKSQTPNRGIHSNPKITHLVGIAKKSDPFMKELRQIYDKENINPNVKQQRVKSQYASQERNHQEKSPRQRISNVKQTKSYNLQNYNAVRPKQKDTLSSNSKYHSTQLPRGSHKSTKRTQHTASPCVGQFQQEYYNAKQEKKEKKMKVMLKDAHKKRKSVQESEHDYMCNYQEETKQSISRDLIGSLKKSLDKNNQNYNQKSGSKSKQWTSDCRCFNHPQKKATHRLLQTENQCFCEKCSVNLVTKGHKMEQLWASKPRFLTKDDQVKQQRLERLKNFLFDIDRLQPYFQHFQSNIQASLISSKNKYQRQKLALDNYYNRIREQVQLSHQKSILSLKLFYDALFQQFQKNDLTFQQHVLQVKNIKDDILPNIDHIIEQERVNQTSFQEIIQNYSKNLKIIEMNLKEISECQYHLYYFNFEGNRGTLLNLREILTPEICITGIEDSQQTQRNSRDMSSGKKTEFFRMSFGKEISESQKIQTF